MLKTIALLFTVLFIAGDFSFAADVYRRKVGFEFEPIEGAKSYEIELTLVGAKKPLTFSVKKTEWAGVLKPGNYSMRLRSLDSRKVPGDWSTPEQFLVGLENVKLISPAMKALLPSKEEDTAKVQLKWQKVPDAEAYLVEVVDDQGTVIEKQETDHLDIEVKVPVAKAYTWKVQAKKKDITSDEATVGTFAVEGTELSKPDVAKPENEYVREISWTKIDLAASYDYEIARYEPKDKKWSLVEEKKGVTETKAGFPAEWEGGLYRIKVQSHGNLRKASKPSTVKFEVARGDRSPAAEYTGTVRQSIDRTKGFYAIASYLITMVKYSGVSYESGPKVSAEFSALGGTGRIGLGYLSKEKPWGYNAIADLSGFTIQGSNHTFATVEANAIYRSLLGDMGELRQYAGLFMKELPEIVGNGLQQFESTQKISALGPRYGIEYWRAINPKLGFQANAHLYYNLSKISTPTGAAIESTPSFQFGLLGSYRLTAKATGLAGYAYRLDSMAYKSVTKPGETNKVDLSGHYLNLFLEWAL